MTTSDTDLPSAVEPVAREVLKADALFQRGRYTEAVMACIEIARKDPMTPGLADLQRRLLDRLNGMRRDSIAARDQASREAMTLDARRYGLVPETYGTSRHVIGDTSGHTSARSRMQQILETEVSMHLENVGLAEIIAQIGASTNINIVADGAISEKTLTVHAENTPLRELLEFVGRNLEVTFSVGESLIWATPRSPSDSLLPLETRIYRLRKGLAGGEVPGGAALGANANEAKGEPNMIEAITRFVPQPDGAEIFFDSRAHILLVKNTKEYLVATDTLINAMDVRPLQVLIEARFVSTTVKDLNNLGIDWLFGRPVGDGFDNTLTMEDSTTIPLAGKNIFASTISGAGLSGGYFGVLDDLRLSAVVNALESSGQGRTLTVPRLATANNKTAYIRIGEDFRYYDKYKLEEVVADSSSENTTYVSRAVPDGDATVEELGYELKVTPSVGADLSTINLVLMPKISDVEDRAAWIDAYRPSAEGTADNFSLMGKLPIFKRKEIETEVVVRSGETVVLGGLVNSSQTDEQSGVPWFVRLPYIRHLFGSTAKKDTAENLIIFVTATLLTDMGEDMIPLNPRTVPGTEVGKAQIRADLGIEDLPPEPLPEAPEAAQGTAK